MAVRQCFDNAVMKSRKTLRVAIALPRGIT